MPTIDRTPKHNYIHHTIKSLYEADPTAPPITLFVGCRSSAYLGDLLSHPKVSVVGVTSEEADMLEALPGGYDRYIWNAFRCVSGPESEGPDGVVFLEDDLTFSRNWFQRLIAVRDEVVRRHGPLNLVTGIRLYKDLAGPVRPPGFGKLPGFWGSQCAYMVSAEARNRVAEQGPKLKIGFDVSLGKVGLGLWTTVKSLVRHDGVQSGWTDKPQTFTGMNFEP